MPSQRITIAKLAGISGDLAYERIRGWSAARRVDDPREWSPEQWPSDVRRAVDEFADLLRENGLLLPVCHFVEWSDMWSMGSEIPRWMTPARSSGTIGVHADRFEMFAYRLPDDDRLADFLRVGGPNDLSAETKWLIARLAEAITSWDRLVTRATLIVLRQVVAGSASDEEVSASQIIVPRWLS